MSTKDVTPEQGKPKRDTRRKELSEKKDQRRRGRFVGEDGEQHWGQGKGKNADRQLAKNMQAIEDKYGPTGPGDGGDMLVRDYVEKWLTAKRSEVRFPTWKNYSTVSKCYITASIGHLRMAAVRPSDMQVCLAGTAGKAAGTRNKVVFLLRSIFASADFDGILHRNPSKAAKRKKDDPEKRVAFTADEEKVVKKYFNDPMCAVMPMLYYTGIRAGELYGLQWKFVNLGTGEIVIDQQLHWREDGTYGVDRVLKTENSRRTVPIPDALVSILKPLRGHRSAYVIQRPDGKHLGQNDIPDMLNFLRDKTGLPMLIHHQFRHDYATRLYRAGVPVKEAAAVMGETVTTMMRIYVHIEKQLGGAAKDIIRGAAAGQVANGLPTR